MKYFWCIHILTTTCHMRSRVEFFSYGHMTLLKMLLIGTLQILDFESENPVQRI